MYKDFQGTHGVNLSADVCGVKLPNPFILASGPETDSAEKVLRAFDCGWGGAILKTVAMDLNAHTNVTPRFNTVKVNGKPVGFTNMEVSSTHDLDWWAEVVHRIKREFPDRPIFASIMRTSNRNEDDWVKAAKVFTQAGVDGFELNFSCSHAFHSAGGGASIGKDPAATEMITKWVRSATDKPVIAKLASITSYIWDIAAAAMRGGADGVSAINSVPGISGFNLDTMEPYPNVEGFSSFTGYSGQAIKPIALRCIGEVLTRMDVPMVGCGGMWTWQDCVEFILMGCSATELCTAPMFKGFAMVEGLVEGMSKYLADKNFSSLDDIRGVGLKRFMDHGDLPRDHKIQAHVDTEKCRGCEICYHACQDGTGDAIEMRDGKAFVTDRCIGCGLCPLVCPADCIKLEHK
ncbi:NAD-dependent dihydropyrimidine dehydrogenase subunit PreA [Pusillibacter faecalis]|uniref:NAD-dependent dihydropyrimidine dehydrogenase subunit PreA n=1 Tax=Pusillibacter faecalis TaxID=2714358 RepID=UPI00294359B9|nr:NAD-dependent dihydropyrimidine dehydrogenase subunit PreA [Pusillibacter faecalis]